MLLLFLATSMPLLRVRVHSIQISVVFRGAEASGAAVFADFSISVVAIAVVDSG